MKRSRFADSQIIAILKQAEGGGPAPELCREHGVGSATFYKWRAKYGGMDASLMARLKELEDENRRLKKMYAEERLKAEIVQEALQKKVAKPSRRREMAQQAVQTAGASVRLACRAFGISEARYRYQARLSTENAGIADRLIRLAHNQRNWGFGLRFLYLRNELDADLQLRTPKHGLGRHDPKTEVGHDPVTSTSGDDGKWGDYHSSWLVMVSILALLRHYA